jgi:nitroreductase
VDITKDFKEIVEKNRTYRRFDQHHALSRELMTELVDLARCTSSAGNKQLIRYVISCSSETNAKIFATLGWASSLPDWPGPVEGERPAGYIVLVTGKDNWDWVRVDMGIAAQTILLGATVRGLGGCMLGNVRKAPLKGILGLGEDQEILLVIALGKPVEEVVLEEAEEGQSLTYYRTEDRVHHVPKLKLGNLILKVFD